MKLIRWRFLPMAIAKIIKYEGDNNTFVWKHPAEDFNNMTQLIVHESQEAIFMMNGIVLDTFGPGKYNLDTKSLPILGSMVDNLIYGDSSFHAEVYFINMTVQMALKWGTSEKIHFIEPNTGIPLDIGASGQLNLRVDDSRKLLIKLVGTMRGISWDNNSESFTKTLQDSFRPLINTVVKTNLAQTIKEEKINIVEITEHLDRLARPIHEKVSEGFEEYGLTVPEFYITDIVLPEEDKNYQRIKNIMASSYLGVKEAEVQASIIAAQRAAELEKEQTLTSKKQMEMQRELLQAQMEAEKTRLSGFAEADVMAAQGITKKDYVQADVQKAFAEGLGKAGSNGGVGTSIAGDMMQMQMGMMAASALSDQMKETMGGISNSNNQTNKTVNTNMYKCPNCGAENSANSKFCSNCGNPLNTESYCPNCGNKIPSNSKFCPNCGQKIGE